MKKYILFDHDGVLVDTEYWYYTANKRVLTEMGIESDTPGKAGGLMSGTASKAVGSCEHAKIALGRRLLPALECRREHVPAQNLRSTRHTRVPRSVRQQSCGPVQQTGGQSQWHFCL